MPELEVFKSFYAYSEAIEMLEYLKQHRIHGVIETMKPIADKVIAGDGMEMDTLLKISPSDFRMANQVIDERISQQIAQLEDDYYLFSFTDPELMEITRQPYEWSSQDVIIARHLLNQRGYNITDHDIAITRSKLLHEMAQPEKMSLYWILSGYLASLSGIFGLIFGLSVLQSKKLLPDGNKVIAYDERTRKHARNTVIISLVMIFLLLVGIFTGQVSYSGGGLLF